MRLRLGLFALVSAVVALAAIGISSFVVDPENIGVRLALYALALLAIIATILFVVFAIVSPMFGRTGVSPTQLADAVAAGRQAYARVTSAVPTGAQLNGAYAYDARLVVAATDVPAYEVSDRVRVHRSDGAVAGRGEIVTVVRLAADAPQVAVTAGPASTPQDVSVPQQAPAWPAR
ncbi:hypothetical protein [Pseudolysinimonas yzui]|uniref:Uncharacterized protein n=1 Tax=Pseudolysinimonas yzui TaxID=2708254 RepID=A0A8J3M1V9_9MICO|nr:hypothetical protein [Pseudolysinimonas yzui]GHF20540.1 hypothetical protein GCM10011600_21910 [Pseudolysinimonas yzui]